MVTLVQNHNLPKESCILNINAMSRTLHFSKPFNIHVLLYASHTDWFEVALNSFSSFSYQ